MTQELLNELMQQADTRRTVIDDRFEEKMLYLTAKLERQFEESARLDMAIRANLRGLGYAS